MSELEVQLAMRSAEMLAAERPWLARSEHVPFVSRIGSRVTLTVGEFVRLVGYGEMRR